MIALFIESDEGTVLVTCTRFVEKTDKSLHEGSIDVFQYYPNLRFAIRRFPAACPTLSRCGNSGTKPSLHPHSMNDTWPGEVGDTALGKINPI